MVVNPINILKQMNATNAIHVVYKTFYFIPNQHLFYIQFIPFIISFTI